MSIDHHHAENEASRTAEPAKKGQNSRTLVLLHMPNVQLQLLLRSRVLLRCDSFIAFCRMKS